VTTAGSPIARYDTTYRIESTPPRSCVAASGTTVRIAPWKPAPNPAPASAATKEGEWLVERSHRDEGAADARQQCGAADEHGGAGGRLVTTGPELNHSSGRHGQQTPTKVADRSSTPEAKARVLPNHAVHNVNDAELQPRLLS